ncbi:MAG: thioredoxin domain-containing protein [Roseiflexaceae bacterium]
MIHAKSPYLLQHAYNPVDWHEWGEDALVLAKSTSRPILLSIGYSACHWCHVMEHETFSDPSMAEIMNANFVCIKVDREERPDLDAVYMTAVQRMTGQGGWPMTMFLTPEGNPFYGGTYYPPEDRGRMPGFRRVLQSVHTAWVDRESQLRQAADDLRNEITTMLSVPAASQLVDTALIDRSLAQLATEFDTTYGGFGGAPKFPPSMTIAHLLRAYQRTADNKLMHMATFTLDTMANSGLYDQIGGGFHRYCVDAQWLVPHFEKMLYDNGLLLAVYAEGFHLTRNHDYARICGETIAWAVREMRHELGGFYSALDADSEGEEGKYYAWSAEELDTVLGENAPILRSFFKVDKAPNFEAHHYVLQRRINWQEFAEQMNLTPEAFNQVCDLGISQLNTYRNNRTRPQCDTKIIASWNGLMITGLTKAGLYVGQSMWLTYAQTALDFVQNEMFANNLLYRIWKDGDRGQTIGFLEDYANVAEAALTLYHANGEVRNLNFAIELVRQIVLRFYDTTESRLYDTSDLHEQLIVRPSERTDNATPSGTATAIDLLLRIGTIINEPYYSLIAEQLIATYAVLIERWPHGFGKVLQAMERVVTPSMEIVVAGKGGLTTLVHAYAPLHALVVYAEQNPELPLCQNKTQRNDQQTVYVCHNYQCKQPVTTESELRLVLNSHKQP